jgi:hypothetical protein
VPRVRDSRPIAVVRPPVMAAVPAAGALNELATWTRPPPRGHVVEAAPDEIPLAVTDEEVMRALDGVDAAASGEPLRRSDFEDEDTPLPEPLVDETSDPVISSGGAAKYEVAGTVDSFDVELPSARAKRRDTAPLLTILPAPEKTASDEVRAVHPVVTGPRSIVEPRAPRRGWMMFAGLAAAAALAVFALTRGLGADARVRPGADRDSTLVGPTAPTLAASAAVPAPAPAAIPIPVPAPTPVPTPIPIPTPTPTPVAAPDAAPRPMPQTYRELLAEARRLRRAAPDQALAMLDRALELHARGGGALVLKAELLLDRDRTDAALAVTDKAIAIDAGNAEAWRTRGKILLGTDVDGAKEALGRYLELRPNARDADKIRAAIDSL